MNSRELSKNPLSFSGLVSVLVVTCLLTSCATQSTVDETGLAAFRERFVASGGVCKTWEPITEPRSLGALECDGGAKLYLFDSDSSRSDVVKDQLEVNPDIRARTHIMLSGDYWLVIDKIPTIIHLLGRMGGMIQGRNGANP